MGRTVGWMIVVGLCGGVALFSSGCRQLTTQEPTEKMDDVVTLDAPLPELEALWNPEDPAQSEMALRQVMPAAQGAKNQPYLAELLTYLARSQGMQGKFMEAHRSLDDAEPLITPDMTFVRLRYLMERGRVFHASQQPDIASPLFQQAWELASSMGHDVAAIDAACMVGLCEKGEVSLGWNEKAITLAETSADPEAGFWLGMLYESTGWVHHELGQYDKALEMFEKSLTWHQRNGDEYSVRVARWRVARAMRSLGRAEDALAIQRELLREHELTGEPNGFVYEELAECLLAMEQAQEAKPYFARAYEALSQDPWLRENEPERLERLKQLAEVVIASQPQ